MHVVYSNRMQAATAKNRRGPLQLNSGTPGLQHTCTPHSCTISFLRCSTCLGSQPSRFFTLRCRYSMTHLQATQGHRVCWSAQLAERCSACSTLGATASRPLLGMRIKSTARLSLDACSAEHVARALAGITNQTPRCAAAAAAAVIAVAPSITPPRQQSRHGTAAALLTGSARAWGRGCAR